MRLLLDTHALIWWFADDLALSRRAHAAMRDQANDVFVSSASVWEIATKYRLGKLELSAALIADLPAAVEAEGFFALPLALHQAQVAGALPGPHWDPFDRMLIAQAMVEGMALVSNERVFDVYGVTRLW